MQLQKYKLRDITTWKSGGTPKKDVKKYWGGAIPWISAKNLTGSRISSSNIFISQEGLENGSRLAKKNSILLLVRGSGLYNDIPIGIVERPVAFNQDVKAIEANEDLLDPWYLLYWLTGQKSNLNSKIEETGIGAGKFDIDILKDLEIELPDITKQKFLANIAKCWDDKIELNRRTNHTLEQIAQTLFKKYFVDDIDPENLPEGWRWGKLEDVTIRITKGTTPTTLKKPFISNGINFLKVENLNKTGGFDKSKLNFIDEETDKLLSRSRIQDKDILFSIAGTLGRMALVNESILPANTNQALAIIRPDLNIVEPLYIFYWLKQSNVQEEIFSKSVQGVQANLSLGVLSDIEIVIPPKNELVKKFENINPIYKLIEQNESEITSLTKTRDFLLPKLMSGEIEVNLVEEELATT